MVTIKEELNAHGVGELISADFEPPVRPPRLPLTDVHFQYTMEFRNAAGVPYLDADHKPLLIDNPIIMGDFDLIFDGDLQVMLDPGVAGATMPQEHFHYGATQSDRSTRYRDYLAGRAVDDKLYREYVAQTTCAVAVIDGCCTETGRLAYREFTADAAGNPARVAAIIIAIQAVIDTGLGIGSAATLAVYRNVKMTQSMNLADGLAVMDKFEKIMEGQKDPVSTSVRLEVFKNMLRGWEDPVRRPYSQEFDTQDRAPIEFDARVAFLKVLEAKLARETGHGSGSVRATHPGPRFGSDRRQSTPRAARVGPFTPFPGESPQQALSSAMAAATFLCSGCQSSDHVIRNCPLYQWCGRCNWCHERRTGCDNVFARSLGESARAARRGPGSPAGRGGGQPRSHAISGGGAGYAHAPTSGGGRRSPHSGRGAPRR